MTANVTRLPKARRQVAKPANPLCSEHGANLRNCIAVLSVLREMCPQIEESMLDATPEGVELIVSAVQDALRYEMALDEARYAERRALARAEGGAL